ncbi:serine hydrolase [Virgibacillus halophilus]|uniref:Serine hydrolase n=1 Tax=Tigheibacillus halophilus TaxID=361280 RepID=A0ABU5C252_9BACI|nr:serine hydrolase [Virgibacillus halophilus]
MKDLQSGDTWENEAELSFYPASMIKLPVMAAIFSRFEDEAIDPEDTIALQQDDIVGGSGVLQYMSPGTEITISDLVMLMIIQSDNTATNILIDLAGMELINELIEEIGMHQSKIHHKLMSDVIGRKAENVTTAKDISIFLEQLYEGRIVSNEASAHMIEIMKKQQIRDSLPGKLQYRYPEETIDWQLAHKTGWVPGYRHDAGIFYVQNRSFIAAVFSKGSDDFTSMTALSAIGLEIFEHLNHR